MTQGVGVLRKSIRPPSSGVGSNGTAGFRVQIGSVEFYVKQYLRAWKIEPEIAGREPFSHCSHNNKKLKYYKEQ